MKKTKLQVGKVVKEKLLRRLGFSIHKKTEKFTVWKYGDSVTLCRYPDGIIRWIFQNKLAIKPVVYKETEGKNDWTTVLKKWSRYQRIDYV